MTTTARCRTCGALKPSPRAACPARASMGPRLHASAWPAGRQTMTQAERRAAERAQADQRAPTFRTKPL